MYYTVKAMKYAFKETKNDEYAPNAQEELLKKATSGDYDNLLNVLQKMITKINEELHLEEPKPTDEVCIDQVLNIRKM